MLDLPEHDAEELRLQFEVIKLDYERTMGFIDGVVRTSVALRTGCATIFLAFLGTGVQQGSWAFCGAAAVVSLVFLVADSYYGNLYQQTLHRANDLERLFQARLRVLDRSYDPYPQQRLQASLEQYDFGVLTNIPVVRPSALIGTRSRWLVSTYVLAALTALITAFLV